MVTWPRRYWIAQLGRSERDGGSIRAEHDAEELVRQLERIPFDAIVDHQQPSRRTLIDGVQPVTGCAL
jgi:hypothetical protein